MHTNKEVRQSAAHLGKGLETAVSRAQQHGTDRLYDSLLEILVIGKMVDHGSFGSIARK